MPHTTKPRRPKEAWPPEPQFLIEPASISIETALRILQKAFGESFSVRTVSLFKRSTRGRIVYRDGRAAISEHRIAVIPKGHSKPCLVFSVRAPSA